MVRECTVFNIVCLSVCLSYISVGFRVYLRINWNEVNVVVLRKVTVILKKENNIMNGHNLIIRPIFDCIL